MPDFRVFDTVSGASEDALDTAVGGGAIALDAVGRPGRTAGRARRRGAPITDSAARTISGAVDDTLALPERAFRTYLRALRAQARREDPVGAAARAVLDMLHGQARSAARFFARVERETETPSRTARRRSTGSTSRRSGSSKTAGGRARSATRTGTRRAQGTGRRAAGTARSAGRSAARGATSARRTASRGVTRARRSA